MLISLKVLFLSSPNIQQMVLPYYYGPQMNLMLQLIHSTAMEEACPVFVLLPPLSGSYLHVSMAVCSVSI